ncbi:MAG: phosphate/phosphite/phosphonate ABC transporter substrate-binding protein [Ancalomicrobiaceae bacterium]|nr:phosphate/phosphite/phosphonate ABC transporter substrate-binding protein [Ancalomicrobiaceae bacterium]
MTRPCLLLAFLAAAAAVLAAAGLRPAAAETSFAIEHLRIGVVSGPSTRPVAERLEPFRAYVADKMGVPVDIVGLKDGQALIDAAATHRIDYAVFTGAAYAMAVKTCGCVEPLAAPKSVDGSAGIRAILVVRNDSPYRQPADLAGKTLSAPGPQSVASRLVGFAALAADGSEPTKLFGRIDTAKGPDAALRALIDKTTDAALAWSTLEGDIGEGYDRGTLHDLVARQALDMHQIRIIWKSELIPNGPHAVRSDLPLTVKNELRDLLVGLVDAAPDAYDAIEPTFGGGFVPIGHSSYLPLLRIVTPPGGNPLDAPPRAN